MEHDITTATTGGDRDRPPVVGVVGEANADVEPAGAASHEDTEARARPSPAYVSVPPDVWTLARGIAAVLGETMPPPIRIITRAVDRLGPDRVRALLGQALTIEASGELILPDDRRRGYGGVFFHLVRASDAISREDKGYIFPRQGGRPMRAGGSGPLASAPPAPVALAPVAWTDETYRTLAQQLQQDNAGRASTVKITVIGRPGAAVEQGQAVALALTSEKVPDLPKGLPEPPAGTRYTVFVARKQWAKVAEALAADAEDATIMEGYAALDPRVEGIAVYATSATTKRLQAAKRAATP